jgi:hypothetical protein
LFALICNKIPEKWLKDKKFFNVSKREQKFYEKLGIRAWKDKVLELGGLGGFSKSKIDDPNSPDLQKEFNAVILHQHPMLSYYKEKYTGGNQAPDCGSYDGINGIERETGCIKNCSECPFNQFNSGENGGKACKTKRRLFLLREGESIPTILTLPTTSLRDFTNYLFRIVGKYKRPNRVVTKFSLTKAQNSGGISYSKVVLTQAYELTPAEVEQVDKMSEQIKMLANKQDFTEVEVEE